MIFDASTARAWLDAESTDIAGQVTQEGNLAAEAFEWYPVDRVVGNMAPAWSTSLR